MNKKALTENRRPDRRKGCACGEAGAERLRRSYSSRPAVSAITAFVLIVSCFLCSCGAAEPPAAEAPAPVKVILDCDMGLTNDDALCLSMLLKAEERGLVDILGITLAGGNNFIDAPYVNYGEVQYGSAKYTEDFLEAVGRTDIPYYRGTDFPTDTDVDDLQMLDDYYEGLDYIKFNDGYGAIHFFDDVDPGLLQDSDEAAQFLISSVRENPGEVVIFAIGPLMNIAKAVETDAGFAPNVKAVYCMGGALGEPCVVETVHSGRVEGINGATVTPVAEYNVLYDPSAFETFITAPFPDRYLLPGGCSAGIDASVAGEIIERSDGSGISGIWADCYSEYIQDYPYWDPMTAYAFLCPEAVKKSSLEYVTVDSDRLSGSFGRTDSISAAEYAKLSPDRQALYGRTEVIYEMPGFWDYTVELLCK